MLNHTGLILLLALQTAAGPLRRQHADIVIVGSGPAGFTLANRLAHLMPHKSIHVLEAGPDPTGDREISTPADNFDLVGTRYDWNYTSTPQSVLGGLTPEVPQGHVLGGGTSINTMQYGRGAQSVFAHWANITGDEGWKFENLLPYFVRSSHLELSNRSYTPVTNTSVYGDGPVPASYNKDLDAFSPFFVDLFKAEGLPEIDYSSGVGIGVTYTTNTIRPSNATRDSALVAFGYDLANFHTVTVQHSARVSKINFDAGCAKSITYHDTTSGTMHDIEAGEVIVSAGAIGSPKLLMLSGVGPRQHLEALGIPVVADVPAIGRNLYDHHTTGIELNASSIEITSSLWNSNQTLYNELESMYVNDADGQFANPLNSGSAQFRVPDDVLRAANATYQLNLPADRPHIMVQYVQVPLVPTNYTDANVVGIQVTLLAPEASGHLELNSSDFRDPPLLYSNYWGSSGDKACIRWAYQYVRELFQRSANGSSIVLGEFYPGLNVTSDAGIWDAIKQTSGSYAHPVGTVSMGKVLDKEFRIPGLDGLRVVDSSIIPDLPSSWLQASVYAIGERAADIIAQSYASK